MQKQVFDVAADATYSLKVRWPDWKATRWLDYLLNIRPFVAIKICQIFSRQVQHFAKFPPTPLMLAQNIENFAKSDHNATLARWNIFRPMDKAA